MTGESNMMVNAHSARQLSVSEALPASVAALGDAGRFVWAEFFSGQLRNKHTRTAYLQAVKRFLAWLEPIEPELVRVTPGLIGNYLDEQDLSVPSKKLHLSALRRFFDLLTVRHLIVLNPALSVRTERYESSEGKTPEITTEQARKLLESIKLVSIADIRDKALIAVLIYTAARAGAVARLKIKDLVGEDGTYSLKFHEKNGKQRSIPVRHDLQCILLQYLEHIAHEQADKQVPFFRTLTRSGGLSANPLSGVDICRMVKRRLLQAGLPTHVSPHSFRSCAATDLLLQGVPLEDVQFLLGHSDVRVTRLYDRRQRKVTRNIVERISV